MEFTQIIEKASVTEIIGWLDQYVEQKQRNLAWEMVDGYPPFLIYEINKKPPTSTSPHWIMEIKTGVKKEGATQREDTKITIEVGELESNSVRFYVQYSELCEDFVGDLVLDFLKVFRGKHQEIPGTDNELSNKTTENISIGGTNLVHRRIGMDIGFEEIFETTPEFLYQWLRAELGKITGAFAPSFEITYPDKVTLVTLQRPQVQGNRFEVEATSSTARHNSDVSYGAPWGIVIRFEAFQLNNKETQVIGGCKNYPGVKDYFDSLWENILEVFPRRGHQRSDKRHKESSKIRLNHTTGQLQPGEYEGDETTRILFKSLDALSELTRNKVQLHDTQDKEDQATSAIYVPKDEKALERWKKAYAIIVDLRVEYQTHWELQDQDPNPKIGEYRDAIINGMDRNYSERNIRRIIKAGDADMLK